MPQATTRNKTRKRQTQRRRPRREERGALRAKVDRSEKQSRRNAGRSNVPEMPEEQAKQRTGRVGESHAIIVSPTGTKHRPSRASRSGRRIPRVARSRAKSPSIGRQEPGRTAKQGGVR